MKKDLLLTAALNKVAKNYLSVETSIGEGDADDNDDAITLAINSIVLTFKILASSFLLSYFLFTIQMIFDRYSLFVDEVSFTPMFIGLIYCVVSWSLLLRKFCRGLTAISPERRLFMRAQGLDIRADYMTYDSFPLMRQLFFWIIVLIIFGLLILTSYILFYLWFTIGAIGMWHALVPALCVLVLIISYLYVVNTIHVTSLVKVFIVLFTIILSIYKQRAEMADKTSNMSIPWNILHFPLMCVQLITTVDLIKKFVSFRVLNIIQMNKTQQYCCLIYILSILLMIFAEITPIKNSNLIVVLWLISCTMFTFAVVSIVDQEFLAIRKSRGYTDPIPLSKTKYGWEAALALVDHRHILLGTITNMMPQNVLNC